MRGRGASRRAFAGDAVNPDLWANVEQRRASPPPAAAARLPASSSSSGAPQAPQRPPPPTPAAEADIAAWETLKEKYLQKCDQQRVALQQCRQLMDTIGDELLQRNHIADSLQKSQGKLVTLQARGDGARARTPRVRPHNSHMCNLSVPARRR
jgi:hypothetical protein